MTIIEMVAAIITFLFLIYPALASDSEDTEQQLGLDNIPVIQPVHVHRIESAYLREPHLIERGLLTLVDRLTIVNDKPTANTVDLVLVGVEDPSIEVLTSFHPPHGSKAAGFKPHLLCNRMGSHSGSVHFVSDSRSVYQVDVINKTTDKLFELPEGYLATSAHAAKARGGEMVVLLNLRLITAPRAPAFRTVGCYQNGQFYLLEKSNYKGITQKGFDFNVMFKEPSDHAAGGAYELIVTYGAAHEIGLLADWDPVAGTVVAKGVYEQPKDNKTVSPALRTRERLHEAGYRFDKLAAGGTYIIAQTPTIRGSQRNDLVVIHKISLKTVGYLSCPTTAPPDPLPGTHFDSIATTSKHGATYWIIQSPGDSQHMVEIAIYRIPDGFD